MMIQCRLWLVTAFGFTVIFAPVALAQSASHFRSDHGLAADDRQPLPERFDEKQTLVWREALPSGHSTPCVAGERVIVTTFDGKELATVALERRTGKTLWRQVAPAERIEPVHQIGNPAAATPAFDGENVYVFFGSFGVLCYDLDGKLVWSKPMGPFQDEFGAASSPVVADDLLLLNEDHDLNNFLIALDKRNGEVRWKVDREGFTRSYATPIVWETVTGKQVVVAGSLQLVAYDLKTGEKLWWVDGLARIVNTTPIVVGNRLIVASWTPGGDAEQRIGMEPWEKAAQQWDKDGSSTITRPELPPDAPALERFFRIDLNQDGGLDEPEWEKHAHVFRRAQNSVMAIEPSKRGDLTASSVVWKYPRGVPYVSSPLYYRGALYVVKNGGIVTSLDPATGTPLKQARIPGIGEYYASPVAGDGKVYLADSRGMLTVLRAGPPWSVLSYHDFESPIMATPVSDGRRMYVRTAEALYCFEAR